MQPIDFPPRGRPVRGSLCASLPRSAAGCQRGVLGVHPYHLLGMVAKGGESSIWSARPAAGFPSLCIHPFASLWSEAQERSHFGHDHGLRAICTRNLLNSIRYYLGQSLVGSRQSDFGAIDAVGTICCRAKGICWVTPFTTSRSKSPGRSHLWILSIWIVLVRAFTSASLHHRERALGYEVPRDLSSRPFLGRRESRKAVSRGSKYLGAER